MQLWYANLKALAVVLTVAVLVFWLAKPICRRFMAEASFVRRRNIWLLLTIVAFASPSFWMFAIVAMPLLIWAARRDENPVALYLLVLYVIPPVGLDIPVVGINNLFKLNSFRLLSLAILLPVAWRILQRREKSAQDAFSAMDGFILAFCALHLILLMPYESLTHTMRRGFLFVVDAYAVYFVVSRTCNTRDRVIDAMATLCLAAAILSPLAAFEWARHWLLYGGIGQQWGDETTLTYLLRGDSLRAQASAGHSIPLGFLLAIAFGFWRYLRSKLDSEVSKYAIDIWICVGLIASFARAPWVVAVAIGFSYSVLAPKAARRLLAAVAISLLVGGPILMSPVGQRFIDLLPFVGSIDQGSVTYREQLATLSWQLIKQNPFFGTPFFLLYLEDLRQGQGIIDLMNTYATIGMFYGLVGLFLFVAFFILGLKRALVVWKENVASDGDLACLAASVVACMFGTLLMMATASFGGSLHQAFYLLAGLAAGIHRRPATARAPYAITRAAATALPRS